MRRCIVALVAGEAYRISSDAPLVMSDIASSYVGPRVRGRVMSRKQAHQHWSQSSSVAWRNQRRLNTTAERHTLPGIMAYIRPYMEKPRNSSSLALSTQQSSADNYRQRARSRYRGEMMVTSARTVARRDFPDRARS